jgi:hypothetical protein
LDEERKAARREGRAASRKRSGWGGAKGGKGRLIEPRRRTCAQGQGVAKAGDDSSCYLVGRGNSAAPSWIASGERVEQRRQGGHGAGSGCVG